MKVTLIILAGGKNLRLGRTKALEIIGGTSLIERVVKRLKSLADRILVVTSPEQLDFPVANETEILVDLFPGKGPLGGIYTGLTASESPLNIVVACDMPFLNTALVEYMLRVSTGYDAVIPRIKKGMVEPLHAVYSESCLGKIKVRLENNQLGVHSFLESVKVRYVAQTESRRFDPKHLSFFNINYPSDIERANALISEGNN